MTEMRHRLKTALKNQLQGFIPCGMINMRHRLKTAIKILILAVMMIIPANTALARGEYADYQLPTQVPHIIVSSAGFETTEGKKAIFVKPEGAFLPRVFTLHSADTGKKLWEGPVVNVSGDVYVLDFSDYEEPGKFYCQVKKFGRSMDFEIRDGIHKELLASLIEAYRESPVATDDIEEKCRSVFTLLEACELFPQSFEEGEIEALVTPHISFLQGKDETQLNSSELFFISAVMAKYSWIILEQGGERPQNTTVERSQRALENASHAFSVAALMEDKKNVYSALSSIELYRAGNRPDRLSAAESYLEEAREDKAGYDEFLLTVSYLNSAGDTDRDISERLITGIMRDAEDISKDSISSDYGIPESALLDDILDASVRLCVVNYIIKNHEYDTLTLQFLHYLTGRNPQRNDYTAKIREGELSLSKMIFQLSAL